MKLSTQTVPEATVVVPTYNAGRYLKFAIESVFGQVYENLSVLIMDDGSTDGSTDFLDSIDDPRVRVIRQENTGKPVAMNRALTLITSEYYCVLDADDLMHPERILRQVKVMEQNPDVAIVFCGHDLIIDDKHLAPRFRAKGRVACRSDIDGFRMPAHDPTALYRTSLVAGVEYEPSLRIAHGVDYILHIGERFPMLVHGECLYSYRIHTASLTKGNPRARVDEVERVIQRACERRGILSQGYTASFRRNMRSMSRNALMDNNLAIDFIESAVDQRNCGLFWSALGTAFQCIRVHPTDWHYYKAVLYVLLPGAVRRWLRPSERNMHVNGSKM